MRSHHLALFCCFWVCLMGLCACNRAPGIVAEGPIIASTAPVGSPTRPEGTYRVALVMKSRINPFFSKMEQGARQAERELGIELIVKAAAQETSVEQQLEILEGLIDDGVDAIVVAPVDSSAAIPVLKKASEAGIVVINVDDPLDREELEKAGLSFPLITVDNVYGAYLSTRYIADQVEKPARAAILEGSPSARNSKDRSEGAVLAFQQSDLITVVAARTAHWKIDEAYEVTAELFAEYPDISLLFCANDMMALGALKYLEETNRSWVKVAAYDGLDESIAAVRTGRLQATVNQRPDKQGYLGVVYAVRAVEGETLPPLTLVEVELITVETLPEEKQ